MNRAARMLFIVAGLAGGCATAPPKQAHVEASSAVRAATEVQNPDTPVPEADQRLISARDHVRIGEKLLEEGDYEGARLHFEHAEADAETSLALTRAHQAEDQAQRAEAQLQETEPVAREVPRDVD